MLQGLIVDPVKNELTLVSDLVRQKTERPCIPVIGATTALEVAWKHFTEATIGSDNLELGREVKSLLQTSYFRLVISDDPVGVELCGALKNVVSIAAGIVDGLEQGDNTKSAILRIGFWEMIELMKELFPNRGVKDVTLEQSCGIAELFVCMSHRSDVLPAVGTDVDVMNIVLGKALAQERRASVNGTPELNEIRSQHVDGAEYAQVINAILTKRNIAQRFPLFTAVNDICQQKMSPRNFIDCLRRHPIHQ
ncbi:unnamed protein product [Calicophoron daubneyi]|uniref:glycerol-3-phosphate dehydrogenase (NAD(+)) n=1 Tax=Calicophoron daubneyi TaxID=300641 RepID=A0AAV2T823_CALDB